MDQKNKLVGRGLKDLIEEHNVDKVLDNELIVEISLDKIFPNPNQPRKLFAEDKIKELADSIKENGILQPLILKKIENNYIIVAGERRYRAASLLKLDKIPAVIRNYSDAKIAEISIIENIQRENLSPIEEAWSYKQMIDVTKITQSELAAKLGKSRSHITNIIGLLNLPEIIQKMILDNKISMGHARVLSKLKDEATMIEFANKIILEKLTVRDIEELSASLNKRNSIAKRSINKVYKNERNILKQYYGSNVYIKEDKVIFKITDDESIKLLLEKLIKNAL
ncbi:ParB/RepB/Spo0J family partition protein [Haploplasma modicum]|uniref:ParB/RepB/Spo0J family partition protein n=1 Tax=Haploplasma modicum TaxID=2150 RepID=UPI00214BF59A|nr:ParB/RepB/Spo0J family partition protein [Haploplasma modicum]MCR1808692.1 ParB/RepB/Spo0J family partition protein [Haploplasma modicum]